LKPAGFNDSDPLNAPRPLPAGLPLPVPQFPREQPNAFPPNRVYAFGADAKSRDTS
jgi:hypothetical protein